MTNHDEVSQRAQAATAGGERYGFEPTDWFEKSITKFGPPTNPPRQNVISKLEEFERDWHDHLPLVELQNRWDYKLVSSDQRCKRYNIVQIRVRNDVRVWFTVVPHEQVAFWLEAVQKQGTSQQGEVISRCCTRARRIWGE